MSTISVIVPVYKVEPYLHRCVDSILAQTFTDFELILVDDGSPDNCGAICDEYAENDSRIHVIHQANGGLSAARNAGIDWSFANSDSQWLSFIDSDDWVHPCYLELLLKAAIECNAGISRCLHVETDGSEIVQDPIGIIVHVTPEEMYIKWYSAFAWGKLYRKECFQEIRYPVGKVYEDVAIWYKLLFAQTSIAIVEDKLYYYFIRSDSIVRSDWTPAKLSQIVSWREQVLFAEKLSCVPVLRMATKRACWVLKNQFEEICRSTKISEVQRLFYRGIIKNKLRKLILRHKKELVELGEYTKYYEFAFPICNWIYWTWIGIKKKLKRTIFK